MVIFVIFTLMQREDLRDRLISWPALTICKRPLRRSDDAAQRLAGFSFPNLR